MKESTSWAGENESLMSTLKWKSMAIILRLGLETLSIGSGNSFYRLKAHAGHSEPLRITGQPQSEVTARTENRA